MKRQLSKSPEELLRNTISRFHLGNLAIVATSYKSTQCVYFDPESGKRCSIGAELTKPLALKLNSLDDTAVNEDKVFNQLPQRLQSFGKWFLQDIQNLHDESDYWDSNGLNKKGEIRVEGIIEEHKLNIK